MHDIAKRFGASVGAAVIVLWMASCTSEADPRPLQKDARITEARLFTTRYAQSPLSGWDVRGAASGSDCGVLLVDVAVILDDTMVEALHYGAGTYEVYEGGVQGFYRDRAFRGVAYRDSSGRIWTYGAVSPSETKALQPCQ
jgi:hypothetical protein